MSSRHGLGPELGYKPTTYTCRCGFRSTDYNNVARHVSDEQTREHAPRRLTTICAADASYPAGIEVASTPYGDEHDAVEIRTVVREGEGIYRPHTVLVRRSDLAFLIVELEAHRLDPGPTPKDAA